MTTIGFATLQIIPSLEGVSEAIEKQVAGKVVNVTIAPLVDAPAAEKAGKKTKEHVEKHTKEVKVEPKVDEAKAQEAGKKTGEAVAKGASGSSSAVGQAVIGALQAAGEEAGRRLGEKIAERIPDTMTGAAQRIGTALRNSLPATGAAAGNALGAAIGIALTDAIGKERLDKAGVAVMSGLRKAVATANNATDIGVAIGSSIAGGLTTASGTIGGAAATITATIGDVQSGVGGLKEFLGGEDSFAAPALDGFNDALGKATPLLNAVTGATTIAAAGAQTISTAVGFAQKAQLLWNAALIANPIGLIVAAIAAVVAGLVLFFTKTELGQKIWQGFTEYLKIAWEAIKIAFGAAWEFIKGVWDGMVEGAQKVWDGVKEKFTGLVDFVKGIPSAIAGAAKGMWDGIGSAFKFMVNGLIRTWNTFANALSFEAPDWVPGLGGKKFSLPTIAEFGMGGYTGGGSSAMVAGVVHGGEYVIKASSTNGIENAYPGLLDYLNNKGALPGFQGGGKVQLGNISGPGITTAEQQSMWDAVRGKFPAAILSSATRTEMTEGHPDYHNAGRAIDISGPGMGSIAAWIASTYPGSLELIHSPFSHNIKNGRDVGDGIAFYGAKTMAGHGDHVHWALGGSAAKTATAEMLPALGVDSASAAPTTAPASVEPATPATSITMPGSISGLSKWGIEDLSVKTQVSPDTPVRTFEYGKAAGAAISGQVSSLLGVAGINDTPGWLKGISQLASGIKIGGGDGAAAVPGLGGSVAPLSAATRAVSAATDFVGNVIGGATQQPISQVNYNIQTTDIEPAYLASQRIEKERSAATLARIS